MKKSRIRTGKNMLAVLLCISLTLLSAVIGAYANEAGGVSNGNVAGSASPASIAVKKGDEFTLTFTYTSGVSDVRAVKVVNMWDETKFRRLKVEAADELKGCYLDIDRIGYDDHTAGFAATDSAPMPSSGSIMYTYEAIGDCSMEASDISATITVAAVDSRSRSEVVTAASVSFAHSPVPVPEVAATCAEDGHIKYWRCDICEKCFSDAEGKNEISPQDAVIHAMGHDWDEGTVTKEPTALSDGIRTYTCRRDPSHTRTEIIPKLTGDIEGGYIRLYGGTRYETGIAVADRLKKEMGAEMFSAAVIASGEDYPDALAGAYLARVKNAPILLVNKTAEDRTVEYIRNNVTEGGRIYLLGGPAAVPDSLRDKLSGYDVIRLGGGNRYETNLLILKEAGVSGEDILICSGDSYADSLSASAAGLPIMLVSDGLSEMQKRFLADTSSWQYYIIGGNGAVPGRVERELVTFGESTRLGGSTRFETSVMVADTFFGHEAKSVTFAYAFDFPDGLCGGPLALRSEGPLILASDSASNNAAAASYVRDIDPDRCYVLGGPSLIGDDAVISMLGD